MEIINHTKKFGLLIKTILIVFILFYSTIVFRCAWLGDDAYITFRVVDNFVNGYGLRWNIDERVQAYTHPLWMFLISGVYLLSNNIYYTGIFTSIIISVLSVSIFAYTIPISVYSAILGILIFTSSKAFIDYSTSGLENPLTHLLLIFFFYIFLKKKNSIKTIFYLSLITSLAAVNRMDTILLFLPTLVYSYWVLHEYKKSFKSILIGFIPFIFWEFFSLIYYGFLFPNTAYTKLNTGISAFALARKGIIYFIDSLTYDPLTLSIISISIIVMIYKKAWKFMPIGVGIFLYLFYILKIGGDFMSGRYFTLPLLCAVIILTNLCFRTYNKKWIFHLLIVLTIGLIIPKSPIRSGRDYGASTGAMKLSNLSEDLRIQNQNMNMTNRFKVRTTIFDERSSFYPEAGLLRVISHEKPDPSWTPAIKLKTGNLFDAKKHGFQKRVEDSSRSIQCNGKIDKYELESQIGRLGFLAGHSVHIVDVLALSEPFLARLPVTDKTNFSIGHFIRRIPLGYIETLRTGKNCIENKNLSIFYDKLIIITRGKIFDTQRFIEIWKMNLGFYDYLTVEFNILPKLNPGIQDKVKQEESNEELIFNKMSLANNFK
jgi:arabinofuranosyltransferase